RKQHLPALRPVAHMMQDAAGLDQIEPACKRPDLEDIGLRILDVANAKRAGLAQREAEAGAAEVDGEYPRARKPLRGLDRVLAGAATGDQHVEAATRCGEPDRRGRELAPQVPFNRRRLTARRRLEPARVGHRLVLALDLERYLVVDRRQRRDRLP